MFVLFLRQVNIPFFLLLCWFIYKVYTHTHAHTHSICKEAAKWGTKRIVLDALRNFSHRFLFYAIEIKSYFSRIKRFCSESSIKVSKLLQTFLFAQLFALTPIINRWQNGNVISLDGKFDGNVIGESIGDAQLEDFSLLQSVES